MTVVLWHIGVSHYSEKVRWALAYKGVEHERREPMPSAHIPVSLWLTRGRHKTFPVLQVDGETIGDSTAIIGALEQRYPEPALYPDDPTERRRALDLEEFFDEQLGPQIRQLTWNEVCKEPERFVDIVGGVVPAPLRRLPASDRVLSAYAKGFTAVRFRATNDALAEQNKDKVLVALDRLETELGDSEYLAGDGFSIADLTAAALFYPLVLPPEAPQSFADPPSGFQQFREPLMERPGYRWVGEMFRKHRKAVAAPLSPARS
jgi:glutathione S-transferase